MTPRRSRAVRTSAAVRAVDQAFPARRIGAARGLLQTLVPVGGARVHRAVAAERHDHEVGIPRQGVALLAFVAELFDVLVFTGRSLTPPPLSHGNTGLETRPGVALTGLRSWRSAEERVGLVPGSLNPACLQTPRCAAPGFASVVEHSPTPPDAAIAKAARAETTTGPSFGAGQRNLLNRRDVGHGLVRQLESFARRGRLPPADDRRSDVRRQRASRCSDPGSATVSRTMWTQPPTLRTFSVKGDGFDGTT